MNKSVFFSVLLMVIGLFGFIYFQYVGYASQTNCLALANCNGPEGLEGLGSYILALPIFLVGILIFWLSRSPRKDLFHSRIYSLVGGIIGLLISFVAVVVIGWKINLNTFLYFLIVLIGIWVGASTGRRIAK